MKSTKQKNIDKKMAIASILSIFKYSDPKTLSCFLQQKPTSSSRFISQLIAQKYLSSLVTPNNKRILYMGLRMWKLALQMDPSLNDKKGRYTLKRKFRSLQNTYHHLRIQKYVASLLSSEEYSLAKSDMRNDFGICPDVFLERHDLEQSGKISVEMEVSSKSPLHLYFKWKKFVEALEAGYISEVRYLFTEPQVYDYYCRLFRKSSWPHVVQTALPGRKIFESIGQFSPSDEIKNKFSFELIDQQ